MPKYVIQQVLLPAFIGLCVALLILWLFPNVLSSQLSDQHTLSVSHAYAQGHTSQPASGYAHAVDQAAPAVVNIYTRKTVKRQRHPILDDPYFRQFIQPSNNQAERLQSSLGSGVLMSADGYVLTNHHVINGADEIVVALYDGREANAMLVGSDMEVDLALLNIQLNNLPFIKTATPGSQSIGDIALAIGNPFGVGQTVTQGIISAIGRNQLGLNTYENYIQTDAAINPGNSGGALINIHGELIGINTAIYSKSGGSEGIGFAIPADTATRVLNDIARHGQTIRGWLGIDVQEATPSLLKQIGLPEELKGLIVMGLYPDGPAEQAGLTAGDIITRIDDYDAANAKMAMNQIAALRPGEKVTLKLLRSGQTLSTVVIAEQRKNPDY